MSRRLDYLVNVAYQYELVAQYVNDKTLKVYSPKYDFDSWLIEETNKNIVLSHMSRHQPSHNKKCRYHVQSVYSFGRKRLALKKIKDHNNYTAFYKKRNKINLVDRVLGGIAK